MGGRTEVSRAETEEGEFSKRVRNIQVYEILFESQVLGGLTDLCLIWQHGGHW